MDGVPTAFPAELVDPADNMLQVVYDKGPVKVRQTAAMHHFVFC